eukprot:TRINITY_DN41152_c0_g1_i1.p1 TRINITY_DN41152_c0_g1~~TRINITY_DN41152_c0_g1_i1.p1  ORF type:complete len:526 (-),score=184.78 TRINITY_DN41152_c0_g1_i1:157-1734(-)
MARASEEGAKVGPTSSSDFSGLAFSDGAPLSPAAPGLGSSQLSAATPEVSRKDAAEESSHVASAMLQVYNPKTISGVLSMALRKELMHLWALHDPATLSVTLVDAIVATVSPTLLQHFLEVANRRLGHRKSGQGDSSTTPSSSDILEEFTAVPEAYSRLRLLDGSDATPGASGAVEHSELLEELQGVLGSLDLLANAAEARPMLKREIAPRMHAQHPWQRWLRGSCALLLPADAVMGVCTVAAPALLAAICAARGAWGGAAGEQSPEPFEAPLTARGSGGDEEASARAAALYDKESLPAGAPQGLAKAVRCRRRVFALERELVVREQAERERQAFEKAEREKSEARIMEVNQLVSEKLKARTEELRRAGQKIVEAQRSVDEMRGQLAEKKREVAQLKYQLEEDSEAKAGANRRDLEHSRSLLRAAERESLAKQRARQRAEQLKKCIDGASLAAFLEKSAEADDRRQQHTSMFEELESQFGVRIQRRKEVYDNILHDFQQQLDKKRKELNDITKRLEERNAALAKA